MLLIHPMIRRDVDLTIRIQFCDLTDDVIDRFDLCTCFRRSWFKMMKYIIISRAVYQIRVIFSNAFRSRPHDPFCCFHAVDGWRRRQIISLQHSRIGFLCTKPDICTISIYAEDLSLYRKQSGFLIQLFIILQKRLRFHIAPFFNKAFFFCFRVIIVIPYHTCIHGPLSRQNTRMIDICHRWHRTLYFLCKSRFLRQFMKLRSMFRRDISGSTAIDHQDHHLAQPFFLHIFQYFAFLHYHVHLVPCRLVFLLHSPSFKLGSTAGRIWQRNSFSKKDQMSGNTDFTTIRIDRKTPEHRIDHLLRAEIGIASRIDFHFDLQTL